MLQGFQNNVSYAYSHITTNTTTTLSSAGPGILASVVVNAPGSAWVLTLKDGANTIGALTPTVAGTYIFNASYTGGLSVVTSGTTPGDATVMYL